MDKAQIEISAGAYAEFWSKQVYEKILTVGLHCDDDTKDKATELTIKRLMEKRYAERFPNKKVPKVKVPRDKFQVFIGLFLKDKFENMILKACEEVQEAWNDSLQETSPVSSQEGASAGTTFTISVGMTFDNFIESPQVYLKTKQKNHARPLKRADAVAEAKDLELTVYSHDANNVPPPLQHASSRPRAIYEKCQCYLTCGVASNRYISKTPSVWNKRNDGSLSKYNSLKFKEYEEYFGDSNDSVWPHQVYFKRCNRVVEENDFRYVALIDLNRESYSESLKKHVEHCNIQAYTPKHGRRVLRACQKCFHIGVTDALKNLKTTTIGHNLEKTKLCVLFGFAYAMECGIAWLYNKGVRKRMIKINTSPDGNKYYDWHDDNRRPCSQKVEKICVACKLRNNESVIEKAFAHPAFKKFKHLQEVIGQKIPVKDAFSALCAKYYPKKGAKYAASVGEHVTQAYLVEKADVRLHVSLPKLQLPNTEKRDEAASAIINLGAKQNFQETLTLESSPKELPPAKKRKIITTSSS